MWILPNFGLGHLLNLKASDKSENFNLQLLILTLTVPQILSFIYK